MKRIGFVGLGTMGSAMARNLLCAGFDLFVYNRTAEKTQPLVAAGAKACSSPAEVGKQSELVVVCVSDTPDVREVILGPQGVAAGMMPGGVIVDCSTSSPRLAQAMEIELKARGIGILDAPVSGGPEGARNAALVIMVGGEESVFESALPALRALGKKVTRVGPAGAGQVTKAVNQILVAAHLEALAEGIALARKCGLEAEKVIDAIAGGAAHSWVLERRSALMLQEQYAPPNFTLALHAKDLRIAMETAEWAQAKLDLAERVHAIFQTLIREGKGDLDQPAVYLYMKKLNALT